MRIRFSTQAWMLSVAAGLVFLPSLDAEAQTFTSQRKSATTSSGTASAAAPSAGVVTAGKSAVQRQLDAMYVKFGVKQKLNAPRIATENIAGSDTGKTPQSPPRPTGKVQQAVAEKGSAARKPVIRQASAEKDKPASPSTAPRKAPVRQRKLIERPASRKPVSQSRPTRSLLPSFFSRRKPEPQAGSENSAKVSGGKSVQEHLKKLYAKDGREMPPMELGKLPGTQGAVTALPPKTLPLPPKTLPVPEKTLPVPAKILPLRQKAMPVPQKTLQASNPQAEPASEPIRQVSDNPFRRLIKRISPFRKKDSTRPVAAPPEVIAEQRALQNGALKTAVKASEPEVSAPSEPVFTEFELTPVQPRIPLVNPEGKKLETPLQTEKTTGVPVFRPLVELPETPLNTNVELPTVPVTPGLEAKTLIDVPAIPTLDGDISEEPATPDEPTDREPDPLETAFPELSEGEADQPKSGKVEEKPATPEGESPMPEPKNPFTGLILDVPVPEPAEPADAKPAGTVSTELKSAVPEPAAPEAQENESPVLPSPGLIGDDLTVQEIKKPQVEIQKPVSVGPGKLPAFPSNVLPTLKPAKATRSQPAPADSKPKELQQRQRNSLQPVSENKPHADKMKRIAARVELRGLKGFCPVQLREHRELRDALPQYSAEFNGVVYRCASADALRKFMAKPYLYAPASSGRDVVRLAAAGEQAEGSLDHAVWYRDRLYLFHSSDSMKTFVDSPGRFVPGK